MRPTRRGERKEGFTENPRCDIDGVGGREEREREREGGFYSKYREATQTGWEKSSDRNRNATQTEI